MRRVLSILLLALLPLQWSAAAAVVVCRHAAQGGHAHGVDGHAEPAAVHAGWMQAERAGAGHDHPAHADRDHAGHDHAAHDHAAHDRVAVSGFDAGCSHPDSAGCCHAAGVAPPSVALPAVTIASRCVPAVRPDREPSTPACDGPFRPPRLPAA